MPLDIAELELKRADLELRRAELRWQKWPVIATFLIAGLAAVASIGVAAYNAAAERNKQNTQWEQTTKDTQRKDLQDAVIAYSASLAKLIDRAETVTYLYHIAKGELSTSEYQRYDLEQRKNILEFDTARERLLIESPFADKAFQPIAESLFEVDSKIAAMFVSDIKDRKPERWEEMHHQLRSLNLAGAVRKICPLLVRPGIKELNNNPDSCPST